MWRRIAQRMLGPSHAADNSPCQDSFSVDVVEHDAAQTLVACVSDGAGSAKFSDVGSDVVCRTIVERACAFLSAGGRIEELGRRDVLLWCDDVRSCLQQEAAMRDCAVRELAATLCAAIVGPASSCFFQIGDGAMILRQGGVYGVVFWPQSGEYANSTNFLTSPKYDSVLEFVSTDTRCSDIALMTDGLERLALRFNSQTPHVPFFEPFFRAIRAAKDHTGLNESLQAFLGSGPVRDRSDDDKTLILASFVEETEDAV